MMLKIRPRQSVEAPVVAASGFRFVYIAVPGAYCAGIAATAPSLLQDYLQLSESIVMHVTVSQAMAEATNGRTA
jgi:hypothetical protein